MPHDAHFTLAISDPRGLSRQLITALYRTVFQRAARVTALIEPDNHTAITTGVADGLQAGRLSAARL